MNATTAFMKEFPITYNWYKSMTVPEAQQHLKLIEQEQKAPRKSSNFFDLHRRIKILTSIIEDKTTQPIFQS